MDPAALLRPACSALLQTLLESNAARIVAEEKALAEQGHKGPRRRTLMSGDIASSSTLLAEGAPAIAEGVEGEGEGDEAGEEDIEQVERSLSTALSFKPRCCARLLEPTYKSLFFITLWLCRAVFACCVR